jgi:hypothetical protein
VLDVNDGSQDFKFMLLTIPCGAFGSSASPKSAVPSHPVASNIVAVGSPGPQRQAHRRYVIVGFQRDTAVLC